MTYFSSMLKAGIGRFTVNLNKLLGSTPFLLKTAKLRDELELLTSYSSDTVYRLRYDSMSYDYVSSAVVRLLGFSPKEMKNINFRALILETKLISDGIKKVNFYDDLEASRKAGDVSKWQADYLLRTKDGRKIWVTDVSFPWFDKKGDIIGSIGSLRDITERVKAEEMVKEELIRLAHTDVLTGLTNRRVFFNSIESELKRYNRTKNDFSILLIDIDFFKKINDKYGHDAGDRVLVELGNVMKSCLRETDVVSRVGGEEFGIFLPDTAEDGAYWVAERICTAVAKHNFFINDSILPVGCTVSIGVSSTNQKEEPGATDLYKEADTRLYIAKNTGRNQVSMDEIVQLH